MKYFVRAVKYFFYLMIILALIIAALMVFKVVDTDPQALFRNGYDSYWQIALTAMLFGALYPKFGFQKRKVYMPGSTEEIIPVIRETMENRGYLPEKQDGATLTFRSKSTFARISRMFEDRITFERSVAGYVLEGPSKDLVRIAAALEARFSDTQE